MIIFFHCLNYFILAYLIFLLKKLTYEFDLVVYHKELFFIHPNIFVEIIICERYFQK